MISEKPMKSIFDRLFIRSDHVCPWYLCFSFDNIFRKLIHKPEIILGDLVHMGDRILDLGPGQGYFSVPMARMVGKNGQVIAVDIQEQMLSRLLKRAKKAGVTDTIECRLVTDTNWGLNSEIDFALAFWMVHEVPDSHAFIKSIYSALKPGSKFLLAEPFIHVTEKMINATEKVCEQVGFERIDKPRIVFSRTLLLRKPEQAQSPG